MAVCPTDCFYKTEEGVVLHDKDPVHRLRLLLLRLPVRRTAVPEGPAAFGMRGKMDKCTFCAGGPEEDGSKAEFEKYGRNRLAEGKLPLCAEMCATKALLAGDAAVVSDIYRERVMQRGKGWRSVGLGDGLRQAGRAKRSNRRAQNEKVIASADWPR